MTRNRTLSPHNRGREPFLREVVLRREVVRREVVLRAVVLRREVVPQEAVLRREICSARRSSAAAVVSV